MHWKKAIVMIICITLVCPFLTANSEVSAASYESIDTITLQESPFSIGEGWTLDSSYSSNPPYSLAIGDKEYVAVGPFGSVMKSTDGRNWKALSKFGNYQLTTIAWDGTKYVMFGANTEYEREANYASSEAFVSTDGLQWKKIEFEPGEAIHYLVWGKNKFVAVGREHVFTSTDGENWTQTLTLGAKYGSHPIKYVNVTYFIYGYEEKKVHISKDGLKWTSKPLDTKANINDMVWAKNHYLGVGNGFYTSKDGLTWNKK
ncbi:WD40/YVTN/BNR-like repeat-containing protein [Candidatus Pristimantibacillus sp. PTI5]|uniref:WD40/YVTN/BNR-like repeat-containing protein n=1 Tax=Candidatus Pristimantibacillus sp. PTI5 TaxID=3400422 RepID=UPI003B01AE27